MSRKIVARLRGVPAQSRRGTSAIHPVFVTYSLRSRPPRLVKSYVLMNQA